MDKHTNYTQKELYMGYENIKCNQDHIKTISISSNDSKTAKYSDLLIASG